MTASKIRINEVGCDAWEVSVNQGFREGAIVEVSTNPEWEPGKIVHLSGDHLHIVFRDVPGRTVKFFAAGARGIQMATLQSDPILDNQPRDTRSVHGSEGRSCEVPSVPPDGAQLLADLGPYLGKSIWPCPPMAAHRHLSRQ